MAFVTCSGGSFIRSSIMDALLKFTLYGIAALMLVLINLWFIRTSLQWFSTRELPDTIAPIRVIGQNDPEGRIGQALAGMLLARLGKIRQEMGASSDQLRAPIVQTEQVRSQVVTDPASLSLPQRLYDPIELNMKVGGVEVGGLVNWMQRVFVSDEILQLAVENENGRAIVSGVWNGGKQTIWIELSDNIQDKTKPVPNETIASAMAYALAQKQFTNRIPKVGALDVMEFQVLLDTLSRAATLQHQVALGRIAEADFAKLFTAIEKLLEKTPGWCELTQLAAGLADNGGEPEKAIALYKSAMALCNHGAKLNGELQARVSRLSAKLAASRTVAPDMQITTASALGTWPLNVLGIESTHMSRAPRVAVLGGLPLTGTLNDNQFELVGGNGPHVPDQAMGEYVRTVVQVVRLVAPDVKFVFASSQDRSGVLSTADILSELDMLISATPDIILVTVGPLDGPIFKHVFETMVAQNILVVNAAGNQPGKPVFLAGDPLSGKIATVASIGVDGKPSKFTQQGKSVLWAPGENIPVKALEARVELRDGTTYSAALAAGVAARVLAEHPHMKPDELLSVLHETAKPHSEGQPAVISLAAALKRLGGP